MLAAPAGNDIMYDDKLVEQGRNFCNKIWNSFRLLKGWQVDNSASQPEICGMAAEWFQSMLNHTVAEVDDLFGKFRISEALMAVYRLFRDDFSSWYLEMIKPAYGQPIDGKTYRQACDFLDQLLRLLHPFMPFITEELWQHLAERAEGESIMYAAQPSAGEVDEALLARIATAQEIINGIRAVRARKNISPREQLTLKVLGTIDSAIEPMLVKLGGIEAIEQNATKDAAASSFMVGTLEFNIPQSSQIDVEAERARIQKDIEYYNGFRASVEKKLSNERFVSKAPEAVVAAERKKLEDADAKLAALKASLDALK